MCEIYKQSVNVVCLCNWKAFSENRCFLPCYKEQKIQYNRDWKLVIWKDRVTLAGLRQQHDRGPDPGDTAIPPHCPSYCFLTKKLSLIAYSLVNWLHSWENPKSLCYSHFLTGAPQNTPFGILKNICEIILYRYSAYRGSSFFFYLQFICKFNDVWSFAYLIIF